MYPMDYFLNFLKSFDKGRILLLCGKYDWKIPTHSAPTNVWINEHRVGDSQVCQGAQGNYFGITKLPDGFIIHADVKTEYTEVLYQVFF